MSILSSQPGLDLLATASDLGDIAITGFLLYQLSVGGPVVGLHVSWVFIGYLVYAYVPELYPDQFGATVEAQGFRAISAVVAVYYGVLFSRILQTVPAAGVFALVPDGSGGQVAAALVGIVPWVLIFSGYILVWRGDRYLDENSAHFQVFERFTVDSQQDELRQLQTLPRRARAFYNC